jgi:putative tricarboxylic transport membrane protein
MVNILKEENLCPVPLVVNNQPGGSSTIGTTSVAHSKGNVLMLLTFISGQVAAPLTAGKAAATYRDLTTICNLANDEQFIVVKTDSPIKGVEDLLAKAKEKAGAMTIAGTATGQEDQMCNRLVERAAGIKLRYVPFNSGGECITALLGGHVDMIWANPSEFVPQYEAKMVRPVVVAKEVRVEGFKDVPTFKEKGYNVTFKFFRGIAAPPDIPAETVSRLARQQGRYQDGGGERGIVPRNSQGAGTDQVARTIAAVSTPPAGRGMETALQDMEGWICGWGNSLLRCV